MAEEWLVAIVREHRFTIAVVFPVVGAIVLLASAGGVLPDSLAFNPLLLLVGTAVMRLPLLAGLLPLVDRRAAIGLGVLAGYTWAIEMVGVATGYPYGAFAYDVTLGPMILGVPVALPLFFVPLVLNAYLLALVIDPGLVDTRWRRIPVVVALVVAIDLVLDPAAVAIGFWTFDAGGAYYGVPWTNFAGWVVSGTIAVLAIDIAFRPVALANQVETCEFMLDDLVSFTLLWGAINLLYGNLLPVVLALGFAGALFAAGRLDVLASPRIKRVLRPLRP